jgi:hypothetical protein
MIGRDLVSVATLAQPVDLLTPSTPTKLTSAQATCHSGVYDEWLQQKQKRSTPPQASANNKELWEPERKEMKAGGHSVKIAVPHSALPTYQGTLIQVRHILSLTLTTDCCVTNPTISIPIQVMAKKATNSNRFATFIAALHIVILV